MLISFNAASDAELLIAANSEYGTRNVELTPAKRAKLITKLSKTFKGVFVSERVSNPNAMVSFDNCVLVKE